jgi:hypothetical protein
MEGSDVARGTSSDGGSISKVRRSSTSVGGTTATSSRPPGERGAALRDVMRRFGMELMSCATSTWS